MMFARSSNLVTVTESVMLVVVSIIVLYVITLYFIGSLRKTLRKVPASMQSVSAETSWLLLVPVVSYVVSWVMLPFSTPNAIRQALQEEGSQAWFKARSLSRIGLALCILVLFNLVVGYWVFSLSHQSFSAHNVPQHSVLAAALFSLFMVAELVAFILYWCKLVAVRPLLDQAWERRFNPNQ
jgi:hypothetical protein